MDFEDDEEEEPAGHRHPFVEEANGIPNTAEDNHTKTQSNSTNKTKATTKLSVQDNNNNLNDQQPGDEWEEFEDSKSKYEQLRLKFARPTNDNENENDDEYYDDENNHQGNFDENANNLDGGDEQSSRTNRRREQPKDKPVWKLDQVQQPSNNTEIPVEKVEEPPAAPAAAKPATTGAYRPPQLRGNSSVTVVSAPNQRVSKKEKPNLASTEEFPSLGTAVNKK
jgi:hypothetical protein